MTARSGMWWVKIVDSVITEAVALVSAHVRGLGGVGTILTLAALLRDETSGRAPLVAIDNRTFGGMTTSSFSRVPGSRALREPVAVETEFSADDDVVALRGVARQLADDLDQQFGMRGSSIPE